MHTPKKECYYIKDENTIPGEYFNAFAMGFTPLKEHATMLTMFRAMKIREEILRTDPFRKTHVLSILK